MGGEEIEPTGCCDFCSKSQRSLSLKPFWATGLLRMQRTEMRRSMPS